MYGWQGGTVVNTITAQQAGSLFEPHCVEFVLW